MADIRQRFEPLFYPKSLTLIGASRHPGKWGSVVLSHIIGGHFRGNIYPIHREEGEIQGLKTYPSIEALPESPDLAVIVVPPSGVPAVLEECTRKGIKAGIVITAGFAEVGAEGERLQEEMVRIAREGGMRFVGPNCFGIINTACNLSPTMPPIPAEPGHFAIVSQSGNVAGSLAGRLAAKGFGVSKLISSGNEADLHCEDYFEYLAEDEDTKVILSYIEGVRDGRKFLETAKRLTRKKPIIVIKAGHTSAGASAARSHTAALAGSDTVFDAACKQAGIIRVRDVDEMFNVGAALLYQPLPKGRRIAMITAGGGWGVLGADACAESGLTLSQLPDEVITELDEFLPAWWSRNNPVDLVAGTGEAGLLKAEEVLIRCSNVDGLILLNPRPGQFQDTVTKGNKGSASGEAFGGMEDSFGEMFDRLMALATTYNKPILVAAEYSGYTPQLEAKVNELAAEIARGKSIVWYSLPNHAASVFVKLAQYAEYLRDTDS